MADTVYLLINGKRLDRFTSYEIDSDLYAGADAFSLELSSPEVRIETGMPCELWVNNIRELTGLIDKTNPSYDKSGTKFTVTGRNLMGLLVDSHVEEFFTLENYDLLSLAEKLLKNISYTNMGKVLSPAGISGRLKSKGAQLRAGVFDTSSPLTQVELGLTVFEVLRDYARSCGLLFRMAPDGTFRFDKPASSGAPVFGIYHRIQGKHNNVLSGELSDDISKRYSKITVVGQKQGTESTVFNAANFNIECEPVTDPSFPKKLYKPYILKDEFGGKQPKLQAELTMRKMVHDGYKLQYSVPGHSQGNNNWTVNEMCRVVDEHPHFKLDDTFLITGRKFKKSKEQGTITSIRLGMRGYWA